VKIAMGSVVRMVFANMVIDSLRSYLGFGELNARGMSSLEKYSLGFEVVRNRLVFGRRDVESSVEKYL